MSPNDESARFRFLIWAVGLYAAWTLATYVLEGHLRTLLRPEATDARLAYAAVANILVGIVGTGVLLHVAVRDDHVAPRDAGFRSFGRTLFGVLLGAILGAVLFLFQRPASIDTAVLANAYAQVWVVSVAEILVCWAAVGVAVGAGLRATLPRWAGLLAAWVVAAVAFGAYHVAHSPPFNTWQMIGVLTVVGLGTGAFFFVVGEVYGTVVFHNFLALKGVTDAVAQGGKLDEYNVLDPPLLWTALFATVVLLGIDRGVRSASSSSVSTLKQ
jgi:hypothetical protein